MPETGIAYVFKEKVKINKKFLYLVGCAKIQSCRNFHYFNERLDLLLVLYPDPLFFNNTTESFEKLVKGKKLTDFCFTKEEADKKVKSIASIEEKIHYIPSYGAGLVELNRICFFPQIQRPKYFLFTGAGWGMSKRYVQMYNENILIAIKNNDKNNFKQQRTGIRTDSLRHPYYYLNKQKRFSRNNGRCCYSEMNEHQMRHVLFNFMPCAKIYKGPLTRQQLMYRII